MNMKAAKPALQTGGVATLAVVAIRRTRHTSRSGEVDVGAGSESWLSEQRGRKDS